MIMANENSKIQATTDKSQIVLYQPDESIRLEVKLDQDTVWLNRQQMAQLFGRDIKTIGKHINNALHEELASDPTDANFATIENSKNPTVAKFAIVQKKVDVWLLDKLSFIALTLFYLLVIVSSLIEAFNSDVGRMLFYVTIFFKAIP